MRALAETTLSDDERALLQGFAEDLRRTLGRELHAVWLFGSRARGDLPLDPYSDVDVLVVVDDASWEGKQRVHAAMDQAAARLGLEGLALAFSVHIKDPAWLAQRREIRSFFIAEVDRDKVVVFEDVGESALG